VSGFARFVCTCESIRAAGEEGRLRCPVHGPHDAPGEPPRLFVGEGGRVTDLQAHREHTRAYDDD
jgi:hypothetical protein